MSFDSPTGRLSNGKLPELQNIPIRTELGREIREAFVGEVSPVLLSADYSQMEERLMARLDFDPYVRDIDGEILGFKEPGQARRFPWATDPDEVEALESTREEK